MMAGTIAQKMGIKAGTRAYLYNAPPDVVEAMTLPMLEMESELNGEFDYMHFFAASQAEFREVFPRLKAHLKADGSLWVSWRKNKKAGTDLSLTVIIKLGYDCGLVESKVIAINADWSAIKFTHPKPGKTYKNSFGKLK